MSNGNLNGSLPASPIPKQFGRNGGVHNIGEHSSGLTKRETFAMAAMQGMVANSRLDSTNKLISEISVSIADALLAALEEK